MVVAVQIKEHKAAVSPLDLPQYAFQPSEKGFVLCHGSGKDGVDRLRLPNIQPPAVIWNDTQRFFPRPIQINLKARTARQKLTVAGKGQIIGEWILFPHSGQFVELQEVQKIRPDFVAGVNGKSDRRALTLDHVVQQARLEQQVPLNRLAPES